MTPYATITISDVLITRWHRLGISVKGGQVTLISNCSNIQTEYLNRTLPYPELDIDGILHVARNMESDDAFIVSIGLMDISTYDQ